MKQVIKIRKKWKGIKNVKTETQSIPLIISQNKKKINEITKSTQQTIWWSTYTCTCIKVKML